MFLRNIPGLDDLGRVGTFVYEPASLQQPDSNVGGVAVPVLRKMIRGGIEQETVVVVKWLRGLGQSPTSSLLGLSATMVTNNVLKQCSTEVDAEIYEHIRKYIILHIQAYRRLSKKERDQMVSEGEALNPQEERAIAESIVRQAEGWHPTKRRKLAPVTVDRSDDEGLGRISPCVALDPLSIEAAASIASGYFAGDETQ